MLGSAVTAAVLQIVLAATGDFTTAVRASFYLLLAVLVVGIAAAFAFRQVAAPSVTDSARASDPGLPVTRPS